MIQLFVSLLNQINIGFSNGFVKVDVPLLPSYFFTLYGFGKFVCGLEGRPSLRKSHKTADFFRTSLSPPPASTDTYGGLFLKARTDNSRHLVKKRVCYHSWGNISFSLEIHKFWCQVITFGG